MAISLGKHPHRDFILLNCFLCALDGQKENIHAKVTALWITLNTEAHFSRTGLPGDGTSGYPNVPKFMMPEVLTATLN